jgi:uncharacterized protein
MKPRNCRLCCFTAVLLFSALFLQADDLTNKAIVPLESWTSISNQLCSVPLEKIRESAEHGDLTAQYYLGVAYLEGIGVSKDQDEGLKWIKLGADLKYANAEFYLGRMYQMGTNNVSQDYDEAAKFYRLAADQGHAMAQNNLGFLYYEGFGVPQDSAEAMKWYQKSADQGNVLGEENLGFMYRYPANGIPNYELAEKWMQLAAEQGSAQAEYFFGRNLELFFDKNGHQIPEKLLAAGEWYRKAAEQGHAEAQYHLAEMYYYRKLAGDPISNSIPWFLKAAAQGNAAAQSELSQLKIYRPNTELLKTVDAVELLRQSAENGNLDSQFDLAQRYQKGIGVPKDAVEAFKWMQKAVQNDQPTHKTSMAMCELALMYEKGEGVTQDLSEARSLFLGASGSEFRNGDATFRAGQIYEKGDGVPQDDQKAAELYENIFYYNDVPEIYPNGRLFIDGPTEQSIESLYRLWAHGRGFPSPETKKLPGYASPDGGIKIYWERFVTNAQTEFYAGEIYYQGKLVPQDLVEADARFRFAASQGLDDARKMLAELEPKMSVAQIEAAKTRLDSLEKLYEQARKNDEQIKEAEEAFEKLKRGGYK